MTAAKRECVSYFNTDLDLRSDEDLRPLTQALCRRAAMYTLHVGQEPKIGWMASLGHNKDSRKPNIHICALLDAIEQLRGKPLELWNQCKSREFNVGYGSGYGRNLHDVIPHRTIRRILAVGGSIGITVYPVYETIRETAR